MEGYIGEIRMFAGGFAPRNWMFCHGQTLQVAQNTALFSILGTIYGGDGRTTFMLPDMRGRVPTGVGKGPSLQDIRLGEVDGHERVSLTSAQLPAHTHALRASSTPGDPVTSLAGAVLAGTTTGNYNHDTLSATLGAASIGTTGASQPFEIRPPYLGVNFIICVYGLFPERG